MASEKTSNIGLNKWTPSDYVKVDEFNDNFDKIDEVAADHAAQLADVSNNIGDLSILPEWLRVSIANVIVQLNDNIRQFGINVKTPPYNASGNGETDDSKSIQSALDTGLDVWIPTGKYYAANLKSTANGQRILGSGEIIGSSSDTIIDITHDDVVVDGLGLDANSSKYTINITGKNAKILRCNFKGNVGHYITSSGEFTDIIGNTFDGTDTLQTTPVVLSGAKNFKIANNTFIDVSGFNLQIRWSKNGTINGNTFANPIYKSSSTIATGGESQITVSFEKKMNRVKLYKNGILCDDGSVITSSSDLSYLINLNTPASNGDEYHLVGYRSLECININSESENITINGNTIDGTGDSGIVIGSDYRSRTLDPNNTTPTDYPKKITIGINIIKNCAYAGIAETHSVDTVIIAGNTISNCGILTSGIFSSGIYVTGGETSITGNSITNDKDGITKYGVHISGSPNAGLGDEDISVKVGGNTFSGIKTKNYWFAGSNDANQRKYNIILLDGQEIGYPGNIEALIEGDWVTTSSKPLPPENEYFRFDSIGSGGGWVRSTQDLLGGKANIETVPGEYGQAYLKALDILTNSLVKVTFRAKAKSSGGKGYLSLYYGFDGDPDLSPSYRLDLSPSSTSWRLYTMIIVVDKIPNNFIIRIGTNSGDTPIRVQHLRIDTIPLGTLND